jgi:hypothetical protein
VHIHLLFIHSLLPLAIGAAACTSARPHADHIPRHGGLVLMNGDLHFEVVLSPTGTHRIFFSDAVRRELPPSVAADVTITIDEQSGRAQVLRPRIDTDCGCWVAEGHPVDDVAASARVAFTAEGKPYWIDLPFGFSS